MPRLVHRRTALISGLAACAPWIGSSAAACEVYSGLLRVTHPWSRATAADATEAVLCMRIDEVTEADRLIGVRTPVAEGCEMGGPERGRPVDVAVGVGSLIDMHEDGIHLRLTGLKHGLQVVRDYPLAIEFERSGLVLARLSVDFTAMRFR